MLKNKGLQDLLRIFYLLRIIPLSSHKVTPPRHVPRPSFCTSQGKQTPSVTGLCQQRLTREPSLFHEVPLELGVREKQVIQFVHAEVEHFIHVLTAVQILVKGLDFSCGETGPQAPAMILRVNIRGCAFTVPGLSFFTL